MSTTKAFRDRISAGKALAQLLRHYAGTNAIVLALPRGGVPVAHAIARELNLALDIIVVQKLGVPGNEELAMGAICSGGIRFLQEKVVHAFDISDRIVNMVSEDKTRELTRREKIYRAGRESQATQGRIVIMVDDGLATGATMKVALMAVRKTKPAKLVIAVPVAATDAIRLLKTEVDDVVCLMTPEPFYSVGNWYENFTQVSDEEVIQLLATANMEC